MRYKRRLVDSPLLLPACTSPAILMSQAPWDIYAQQQYCHKLGYPLWVPDPAPEMDEIHIGDVGWLEEGEFLPLFHAIDDPPRKQPRGDVPTDHTPFEKEHIHLRGPRERITQPVLCSQSIRRIDVSSEVSTNIPGYVQRTSLSWSDHLISPRTFHFQRARICSRVVPVRVQRRLWRLPHA